jgi:hypothetical protein
LLNFAKKINKEEEEEEEEEEKKLRVCLHSWVFFE